MATKKKRLAEKQITPETSEDETGQDKEAGSWKEATGDKMKQRKILKVKRKDGELEPDPEPQPESESTTTKALPSFDFGVESSESAPSFDFQWKGDGESNATAKEGGEKEGTSESEADSGSSSSWSFSWGSDGGGFSAFDASAFKSFGSVASEAGTESAFSSTGSDTLEATASAFVEQPPPVAASAQIFKDKKAEKAGTEDDKTLLRVQSKVYVVREEETTTKEGEEGETKQQAVKEQKFVESGHGDLHVNLFQEEGKTRARLVLRMEKTQRLVLNAPIFKDMDFKIQGEKFLRVISFNLEGKPTLYLLKFKTKQEAQQVKLKMDAAIKKLGLPYGDISKEPEQEPEPEPSEETTGTA